MPRTLTYQILDEPDGRFSVVATLDPNRVYRRDDLSTLAEAEDWVEGLRVLMAACGAPVVRAESAEIDGSVPVVQPSTRSSVGLRQTSPATKTGSHSSGRPPQQSFIK